jgi:hypothetical protein
VDEMVGALGLARKDSCDLDAKEETKRDFP